MTRRRRAGRHRKVAAPRHPGGQIVRDRDSTLPPPEVIARRLLAVAGEGAAWQDQRAGSVFGIMLARKLITLDQHNAGMAYGERCAAYEALIGSPRGFGSRPEGRSLATEDPARWAWAKAEMAACRKALAPLDQRCRIALTRAVHDMPEAMQWAAFVTPALQALHDAEDMIKRAGRAAAMMEAA